MNAVMSFQLERPIYEQETALVVDASKENYYLSGKPSTDFLAEDQNVLNLWFGMGWLLDALTQNLSISIIMGNEVLQFVSDGKLLKTL